MRTRLVDWIGEAWWMVVTALVLVAALPLAVALLPLWAWLVRDDPEAEAEADRDGKVGAASVPRLPQGQPRRGTEAAPTLAAADAGSPGDAAGPAAVPAARRTAPEAGRIPSMDEGDVAARLCRPAVQEFLGGHGGRVLTADEYAAVAAQRARQRRARVLLVEFSLSLLVLAAAVVAVALVR